MTGGGGDPDDSKRGNQRDRNRYAREDVGDIATRDTQSAGEASGDGGEKID